MIIIITRFFISARNWRSPPVFRQYRRQVTESWPSTRLRRQLCLKRLLQAKDRFRGRIFSTHAANLLRVVRRVNLEDPKPETEITVFKSLGLAVEDLAAAKLVLDAAPKS